ncbi:MAG: hypothetical protein DME22_06255 [Verrucomicrobia bacterium]|nr:MAG: hypothetical protein DME22_06255 [Verrucomicrobiota bacterium]
MNSLRLRWSQHLPMNALDRRVGLIVGSFAVIAFVAIFGGYYYSFMWSEWFLAPVHVGMSKSQVRALVGTPRRTRTNDSAEVWSYTRSWSRDANVYFDTNGIVWGVETD